MESLTDLELKISRFLRIGVILAGIILFAGWIWSFDSSANPFYSYQIYDHIPFLNLVEYYFIDGQYGALIVYGGLFILISLPIIRVFLTGILFFLKKEFLMGSISFIVLILLIISFSFGIEL
ncbi:MAG: DUF1634 domain-containing protein [Bacteriovoracaceae bacterium]